MIKYGWILSCSSKNTTHATNTWSLLTHLTQTHTFSWETLLLELSRGEEIIWQFCLCLQWSPTCTSDSFLYDFCLGTTHLQWICESERRIMNPLTLKRNHWQTGRADGRLSTRKIPTLIFIWFETSHNHCFYRNVPPNTVHLFWAFCSFFNFKKAFPLFMFSLCASDTL